MLWPNQRIASLSRCEPLLDILDVLSGDLEPDEPPAQFLGDGQGRAASAEWIEHNVAFI